MKEVSEQIDQLTDEQLLAGSYGCFAAIGHEPQYVTMLAARGQLLVNALRSRWPRLRRRCFSQRTRMPGLAAFAFLLTFHFSLLTCFAANPRPLAPSPPRLLAPLFNAMCQVESNNGEQLVGDDGRSIGHYQIQRAYHADSGVPGSYSRCKYDKAYSERVMLAWWRRHVPDALAGGNYQRLARTHNGGPRGDRNPATLKYWKKVKAALKS